MKYDGYHGTSATKAHKIGLGFEQFEQENQLGTGVYFFVDKNKDIAIYNATRYPLTKTDCRDRAKIIHTEICVEKNDLFDLNDKSTQMLYNNIKELILSQSENRKRKRKPGLSDDEALGNEVIMFLNEVKRLFVVVKTITPPNSLARRNSVTCVCVINKSCINLIDTF